MKSICMSQSSTTKLLTVMVATTTGKIESSNGRSIMQTLITISFEALSIGPRSGATAQSVTCP